MAGTSVRLSIPRLLASALLLVACGDRTGEYPLEIDVPLSMDYPEPCGARDNPCLLDGIWVVSSPSGGQPRACTETPGGCFPPDPATPIIWGPSYAAEGWSVLNPKGTGVSGPRALTSAQRSEVQMAIRQLRCPVLQSWLNQRLNDGSLWGSTSNEWFGYYAESSETMFISLPRHWEYDPVTDQYTTMKDWDEFKDTLVHEAAHDWFGPSVTPDDDLTNVDKVIAECL